MKSKEYEEREMVMILIVIHPSMCSYPRVVPTVVSADVSDFLE